MQWSNTVKGTCGSLSASILFGLVYFYSTLLAPLNGLDIFGWRMLWTIPCLLAVVFIIGAWPNVTAIYARTRGNPSFFLMLMISSLLIGLQLWLFMWAPVNGKALDVSLGYLLMPLVMVVVGRFHYHDRLQKYHLIAVCFAVLGVVNQLWQTGRFSWTTLLVAIGFPLYFVIRKSMKTDNVGGLWVDIVLTAPVAMWIVGGSDGSWSILFDHPGLLLHFPLLGVISAVSTACFIIAGKYLSLSLFGLLSYVEPMLLVAVALIIGERVPPNETLTYASISLAILTLAFGGVITMLKQPRWA